MKYWAMFWREMVMRGWPKDRAKRFVRLLLDWIQWTTLTIATDGLVIGMLWNWFVVPGLGATRIDLPVAIGLDGIISFSLDGVQKKARPYHETPRMICMRHLKIDAFYLTLGFIVSRFV